MPASTHRHTTRTTRWALRLVVLMPLIAVQCAVPQAPPKRLALRVAHAASAIAQWTFAGDVSTPSTGTGIATLVGGTSAAFASGFTGGADRAWSTSGYPSQGSGNKTAGTQFAVSTAGYSGITLGFEKYHSNTAANTVVVQVSTDAGASFTDVQTFTQSAASAWGARTVDLSANLAIENNANAVFRVVTAFTSTGAYSATNSGSNYSTAGAIRFDDVTISGTTISGDLPPVVQSTSPFNGASNIPANGNIAITFSEPVTTTGNWFQIVCTSSGTRTVADTAVSGGPTTFTLNPTTDFASSESCAITVIAAQIADIDGTPNNLPADYAFGFAVATNACTLPFTHTYDVQGATDTSPLLGAIVAVQGVVVGDYEGLAPNLRGFYVQDQIGDTNPNTSDGLFVFNSNAVSTTVGQVVRVGGTVQEFQGQTQLSGAVTIISCNATATMLPTDVTLPITSTTALEKYEGMLVRLPQTLFVTEHFQLGRFGQITLSSGDRLRQPTTVAAPGAAAQAVQAQNDLNRIILDDNVNAQNAAPIVFGRGGLPLSAANTLRGGDTVSNVVGMLTYGWAGDSASPNAFRVRPTVPPVFIASNARPAIPAPLSGTLTSTLKVTSVNLLNFFNTFGTCTLGVGGASTDCRGADSPAEFERQAPKTVANIVGTGADVIGFMEMQNNGYGSASAIQELVTRLNAATAPNTYAFIDVDARTGQVNALGVDAIKVGLIYKPAKVTPISTTVALNTGAFGLFGTQIISGGMPLTGTIQRNRPALAQTFLQPETGEQLTVAVAHLKSKGSSCADNVSPVGPDPDAGDGQGNCNLTRKQAATELVNWLNTGPTGVASSDVLVIGDLNAYAQEDPVTALTAGGYANLMEQYFGAEAYSYAFDGQWGYLDYAFASPSLTAKIAGVSEWHINADEPGTLDYNTNFKSGGQQISLYAADAFRSSDHDPVIVGINGNGSTNGGNLVYLPLVRR